LGIGQPQDAAGRGHSSPSEEGALIRLSVAFAVAQFILHSMDALLSKDPRLLMPHIVAYLHDLLLLEILLLLLLVAGRMTANRNRLRRCWYMTGIIMLFTLGLLLSIYPGCLAEFLAFPWNIFNVSGSTVSFFFTDYLGWRYLWPVLISSAFATYSLLKWRWKPRPSTKLTVLAVSIIVMSLPTLFRSSPHPLLYGIQQSLKEWFLVGEREVPPLVPPLKPSRIRPRLCPSPLESADTFNYEYVIVVVFEGVEASRFEEEFFETEFYKRIKDKSVYFSNYYTTNLDSYTSLIAMVTSVLVPFRAYTAPESYRNVNEAPNIVKALREHNFKTLFVTTYYHLPFVPVPSAFDRVITAEDISDKGRWVEVGVSRMEAALEDRASISPIVEFIKSHKRTFVLHEMVFGHTPRWISKTGRHQCEYYAAYLAELFDLLDSAELAEKTLLVVVSDHGDRFAPADVESYHIPLLVSGTRIKPQTVSTFLSHLDFQQIVAHYLCGLDFPEERKEILTVGSTERWVYGRITRDGGYQFIDDLTGTVLSSRNSTEPVELYKQFQSQINDFATRFQQ